MEFSKIINDITEEYINLTNKNKFDIQDMNIINLVMFEYLRSYYFKDLYSAVHLKENDEGYKAIFILKNENNNKEILDINGNIVKLNEINDFSIIDPSMLTYFDIHKSFNYYKKFDVELEQIRSRFSKISTNNDSEIKNVIIEKLLFKDDFYNMVFEESTLKRLLNMKNKDDIRITKIECENLSTADIYKRIKEINKIPTYSINKLLDENYSLKYINTIKTAKNIYIAHNNYEIAGLLLTNVDYHLKNVKVKDYKKFNYVEAISVSKSFNGKGIGIKLYEELLKDATLENGIIMMSKFTDDGSKYLEEKFSNINNKYQNVLVVQNDEKNNYAYKLIEILFKNETSKIYNFETEKEVSQLSRKFLESFDLLKDKLIKFKHIHEKEIEKEIIKTMIESIDDKKLKVKIKPQ